MNNMGQFTLNCLWFTLKADKPMHPTGGHMKKISLFSFQNIVTQNKYEQSGNCKKPDFSYLLWDNRTTKFENLIFKNCNNKILFRL